MFGFEFQSCLTTTEIALTFVTCQACGQSFCNYAFVIVEHQSAYVANSDTKEFLCCYRSHIAKNNKLTIKLDIFYSRKVRLPIRDKRKIFVAACLFYFTV